MVPESELEKTEHGLVPKGEGWFVLNMRDAVWRHVDGRGAASVIADDFEGERQFEQLGVNPFVLGPGEPMAMYHWEGDQEDFLVVAGEAVLIVEGEERYLNLGATRQGRVLLVVTTWRRERVRVVTAFEPIKRLIQFYYKERKR